MNDSEFGPVVIGKLLNIGGMLQRRANQLLLPFDLNQQQFSILFEIGKAGRVSQKDMVNRMMLEKAHVSKIIKKLSAAGLIEVTPSSEDKRSSWLSITEEGNDLVGQCRGVIQAWNIEWIDKIEPGRRKGLVETLALLQDVFRENIKNGS